MVVFSSKRWDRRSSQALIESATPCHDAQVVRPHRVLNPLRLTVLSAKYAREIVLYDVKMAESKMCVLYI